MDQKDYDALTEEEKHDGTIRFIDGAIDVKENSFLTTKKLLFDDIFHRYAYARQRLAEYDYMVAHESGSSKEKYSYFCSADIDIRNFAKLLNEAMKGYN